jgi:hypothetical protein
VALSSQKKGPTRRRTVWKRLAEHKRSFRLDFRDRHQLTRLAEIGIGREADLVAYLQSLPRGDDAVGVVNIRAQQILDPFVRVEPTTALSDLDEPGPDGGRRGMDRHAHRVTRLRMGNNVVAWKRTASLGFCRSYTYVPREQDVRCRKWGKNYGRRPQSESNPLPRSSPATKHRE